MKLCKKKQSYVYHFVDMQLFSSLFLFTDLICNKFSLLVKINCSYFVPDFIDMCGDYIVLVLRSEEKSL